MSELLKMEIPTLWSIGLLLLSGGDSEITADLNSTGFTDNINSGSVLWAKSLGILAIFNCYSSVFSIVTHQHVLKAHKYASGEIWMDCVKTLMSGDTN